MTVPPELPESNDPVARPSDPVVAPTTASLETARWFLSEVFRGVDRGVIAVNHLGPRPRADGTRPFLTSWHRPADVDKAAARAVALSAASDVWYGVGVRARPTGGRGTSADVIAITGVWADVDVAHAVHKKAERLPKTYEQAKALIARVGLEPTIVVDSGHGLQAHWLFTGPWFLETDDDRRAAQALSNALKLTLQRHAAAQQHAVDSVADLARVMRVAGTHNRKDPADVRPVTVVVADGDRYDLDDVRAVLLPVEEPSGGAVTTAVVPGDVPNLDGPVVDDVPDLGEPAADDAPSRDDGPPDLDDDLVEDEGDAYEAEKPVVLTDDQLLDRARRARNGPAFDALYRGSVDAHGGDHSAADQALANRLLWWCSGDRDRADRLFRRSGLMRDKWDAVHNGDGATYGAMTMAKAAASFRPPGYTGPTRRASARDADDGDPTAALDPADDAELAPRATLNADTGNAARFARRNAGRLRFCHEWGKWLYWAGDRWRRDDAGRVVRYATDTALAIFDVAKREPDEWEREQLAAHAVRSQRRERITAMVELAKPYLAVTSEQLDADPWLLNCRNGTVDLRTGVLRPHRRGDYLTKRCAAAYDPAAPRPHFDPFLARIFRTHPELARFVQKAAGYGATGLVSEQAMFFFHGGGANGKTTLLDAVCGVLGDYAGKVDRDLLAASDRQAHPTNVADLQGMRVAVCSETNEGVRYDEAKMKDLVGETRVKARFMRCDFFEFAATHKIFAYSNHRPLVRGTDHGFWRRMRLVPFVETIADDEKDTALPDKLKAEADGVLAWVVEGCRLWRAEGLGVPDEVARATADYRREMDSVGLFLDEACTAGERLWATAAELYAAYAKWAEDAGERPLSQKRLGMELAKRGFVSGRDTYSGRKIWRGVGLLQTPD